jgi:hypothetical protein
MKFIRGKFPMVAIEGITLDEDILNSKFLCDLTQCKGACCTFPGEYGAPLLNSEIKAMNDCVEAASEYLSERSKQVLKDEGFYEGFSGTYTTVCIDKQDCVFVYYDDDIAKCALEKAFLNGKTNFRKPVSCHLFPIRVRKYGGFHLYYEKIEECNPGIEKGLNENVLLTSTVRDALVRSFGEEWVNNLLKKQNGISSKKDAGA